MAVERLDQWAGHADQRGRNREARHLLRLGDALPDRLDGRVHVDHGPLAHPLRRADPHAEDLHPLRGFPSRCPLPPSPPQYPGGCPPPPSPIPFIPPAARRCGPPFSGRRPPSPRRDSPVSASPPPPASSPSCNPSSPSS